MKSDLLLDFQFRNSPIWIEYSHKRYLTIDEIKNRLPQEQLTNWPSLKDKIQHTRMGQGHAFSISSIQKVFWYFPADCIAKKFSDIERKGTKLYERIENHYDLKVPFSENAAIEEAITSAIYEGANSTRAKAKQLIAEKRLAKTKDEWMLLNNHAAIKWIKENIQRPIDLDLIKEIHGIVTRNTLEKDEANYTGKFRDDEVFVGPHEGIPYQEIETALNEVTTYITNNPRWIPPIIRGIILHYFIGYIHPFFDGNGRTARTLFYFQCFKNDLKFVELLSISAHLKTHGKRYERSFENAVIHDFDITYFIDFCADSLIYALDQAERKVQYLFEISNQRNRLGLSDSQVTLLQRMALNKFRGITSEEHAKEIGKSREIARQDLKSLAGKGYLCEQKVGKKMMYHIQSKVLRKVVQGL